jgi:hypothetical protein
MWPEQARQPEFIRYLRDRYDMTQLEAIEVGCGTARRTGCSVARRGTPPQRPVAARLMCRWFVEAAGCSRLWPLSASRQPVSVLRRLSTSFMPAALLRARCTPRRWRRATWAPPTPPTAPPPTRCCRLC